MSYQTLEQSRHGGQPAELWKFEMTPIPLSGTSLDSFTYGEDGIESAFATPGNPGAQTESLDDGWSWTTNAWTFAFAPPDGTAFSPSLSRFFGRWGGTIGDGEGVSTMEKTYSGLTAANTYRISVTLDLSHSGSSPTDNPKNKAGHGLYIDGSLLANPEGRVAVRTFTTTITGVTSFTVGLRVVLNISPVSFTTTDARWTAYLVEDLGATDDVEDLGTTLRYTSADTAITFGSETYAPAIFTRSPVRSGSGEGLEAIELTMPRDHAVAQLFHTGLPVAPVRVTMYRVHRSDALAGTSYITPFVGQVDRARFEGPACVLTLASIRVALERKHPWLLVQGKCPFMLYDARCGVNKSAHRFDTTVSAIDHSVVTLTGLETESGADTTKFRNGYLVAPSGEHLFIQEQDGDRVLLLAPPQTLAVDDAVTVYWGCDRTVGVCHSRFDNIARYGGRPLMPQRNPFGLGGMVL